MEKADVLVTGYGLVAPTVMDARGLFALLGQHGSCLREHPDQPSGPAGFIDEQQWLLIDEAITDESASQSRHTRLSRYVAEQALGQAALRAEDFSAARSGLFLGCQPGQYRQTRCLAQWLGVHEYVSSHSDVCAAGTVAIGKAYRAVANGELELALCGGIELLPEGSFASSAQAPSPFIPSEGAALIVLESASHAQRRGARALGRVLGYADRYQDTAEPGALYVQCMQAALHDAGLAPRQVQHVNVHSPSPLSMDNHEAQAVKQVFGTALPDTTFAANKFAVGHALAGSGAIEAVLSLMSLQLGVLLPTPDDGAARSPHTTMNFPDSLQQQTIDAVLSNSFSRNGTSSSLVLGRG
ncbi:beta-ketoacyl-[acyl-carrier-protein] synthase family protein [Pseudomonas sp. 21LCFQ010]|uniref:thiolase family protein n=1 Tax=Pseudomonas sp. 21LCFQ010 TaxID=2957506 RepID=UPI00209699B7|nr:beta-ketoacyl-[acyl-carrier-protein] synthase family protein [Pseudomonas sp. 21LCFQ010]MCO8163513.1 beta-ketoacyl-[acyl-carrier-protein] synthase family protein [Pseudomonas sp. 21LCFQ010]